LVCWYGGKILLKSQELTIQYSGKDFVNAYIKLNGDAHIKLKEERK